MHEIVSNQNNGGTAVTLPLVASREVTVCDGGQHGFASCSNCNHTLDGYPDTCPSCNAQLSGPLKAGPTFGSSDF